MVRTFLALLPSSQRSNLRAYAALSVLSSLLRAVATLLLIPLVTDLFGPEPASAWPWVGGVVLATVIGWFVDKSAASLAFKMGFSLLENAQEKAAGQIARIRLDWFDEPNSVTSRQAIAAVGPDLVGLVIYLFTPLIAALLVPVAISIGLMFVAWPVGLAGLILVPVLVAVYFAAAKFARRAEREGEVTNAELSSSLLEFARTQASLRSSRRVEGENSRVAAALENQYGAMVRLVKAQIPGQVLFTLTSQLALFFLVGLSAWLAVKGDVTVPVGVALIVAVVRYMEPLSVLAMLAPGVETITLTLARLRAVYDAPVAAFGDLQYRQQQSPAIIFDGVSYSYGSGPGETPVIKDLTLEIEPGKTTAVVGPSGSGKSTLLKLAAGLVQADEGEVRLGTGASYSDLDEASRQDLVSVVFQEPYLFEGSLRDNVLLGNPSADAESLERASMRARLQSVIAQVPGGWDARIGEAGTTLSGGERQRVSIARALVSDAPILLLDEATSALDPENEAALMDAVRSDDGKRTRLLVTHSLKTVECADRILFMDQGRIVEDGTLSELLALKGRFAEFWEQQNQVGAWRVA